MLKNQNNYIREDYNLIDTKFVKEYVKYPVPNISPSGISINFPTGGDGSGTVLKTDTNNYVGIMSYEEEE